MMRYLKRTAIMIWILGINSGAIANSISNNLGDQSDEFSNEHEPTEEQPYLVLYGKYCGFGNKSSDYSEPGIDLLDDLCKVHDFCYQTLGRGECNCDLALMNSLNDHKDNLPQTPQARVIISGMKFIFGKNTCERHISESLPPYELQNNF